MIGTHLARLGRRLGITSPLGLGLIAFAGVALAVVVVTITVNVSSNEYQPVSPTEELSVALTPNSDACYDPSYPGYSTSGVDLGSVSFDLNRSGNQAIAGYLCVGNFGPADLGEILISPVATANGEAGCSTSEGSVDPDGSGCGTSGELHPLLVFGFTTFEPLLPPLNAEVCTDVEVAYQGTGDVTPSLFGSSLDSGFVCVFEVYLRLDDLATENGKLAASTDTASYVIDVAGTAVGA